MSQHLLAAILGIIEGLTEFLPVSSTGHLILAGHYLGFESPGHTFEVLIQLGAILAILSVYFRKLFLIAVALPTDPGSRRFVAAILIAFLPAAIVGAFAHKYIKSLLFDPMVVAIALIVGGVAILIIERYAQRPRIKSLDEVDFKTALLIGLCQCLAMIPGVSRAGATIMGARVFRVDRATAAEFSFFLAMPTMLGATVYDLYKNWSLLSWDHGGVIALGFISAFVAALLVVGAFVRFISRHGFTVFAWYRIAVGALALALLLMH